MNPARSFPRRWVHCALTLGGLSLFAAATLAEGARKPAAKPDAKGAAKKLVDAIANRNKPPKLVDRPRGHPERLALFPEGYDWKEDKRVLKALDRLYQGTTVELWGELVRRLGDRRYCVVVVCVKNDDAEIESVGGVCTILAYSHLTHVYRRHLPLDPAKDGERLTLDGGIKPNLAEWRKQRAKKSLYQLQVEVCETALRQLANVKRVSEKEKAGAREKIEAEIRKLQRTKKPIVGYEKHFFPFFQYRYTPDLAKQVREAVRKNSSEDSHFIR